MKSQKRLMKQNSMFTAVLLVSVWMLGFAINTCILSGDNCIIIIGEKGVLIKRIPSNHSPLKESK